MIRYPLRVTWHVINTNGMCRNVSCFYDLTVISLSPPQRPLCVVGRCVVGRLFVLWGGWGERKRERAGHFPSSHRPPRGFYFFDY